VSIPDRAPYIDNAAIPIRGCETVVSFERISGCAPTAAVNSNVASILFMRYGLTQPAKCVVPPSILIIATGLIGSRSGPIVMTPDTPL